MRKYQLLYILTLVVLPLFLSFIFSGCRTQTLTVERVRDSVVYVGHYDTLIVHQLDSVDRYRSGDTVYLTRWRVKEITKLRYDTVSKSEVTKEPYPVEVERKVTPAWCWWLLAVVAGFVLYKVARFAIKVYTKGNV